LLTLKFRHATWDFQGRCWRVIGRTALLQRARTALRRSRVVALIGPRQCGKTTLARQFMAADSQNYFDLEDPVGLARLDEPMTALGDLKGLVVIDEIQRRPELFQVLRVLADRKPLPARSLGVSETTVRRYLDILTGVFMVRQLQPWHANLGKRQIKAPKIWRI